MRTEADNREHPHSSKRDLEPRGLTTMTQSHRRDDRVQCALVGTLPDQSSAADGGQALWILPTKPCNVDQEECEAVKQSKRFL